MGKYLNPRLYVVLLLDHIRQANVRLVSLFVAIFWAVYVDEPGRQISTIDERLVGEWMTAFAIITSPSVAMRTPLLFRRVTHFIVAAHWLAWAVLVSCFEHYGAVSVAAQWLLAVFAVAALMQSLVTDEEDERRA